MTRIALAKAKLIEVSLKSLKVDSRHCFSYPLEIYSLAESVKQIGVVSPVWVVSSDGGSPALVNGFRRVSAAKAAGLQKIAALEFTGTTPYDLFFAHVCEDAIIRKLNLIEQAAIVSLAIDQFGRSESDVITLLMPAIGLSKSKKILNHLMIINQFGEASKKAIYETGMKLGAAFALDAFEHDEREELCRWLTHHKFGLNRSTRLIEAISDIHLREKIAVKCILNEANKISAGVPHIDKQFTALVYDTLMKRRSPHLAQMEAEMKDVIIGMKLPGNAEVVLPENFEGRKVEFKIKADNAQTLFDSVRMIGGIEMPQLKKLYKWL